MRDFVETFKSRSGRKKAVRLDDQTRECLDRIVAKEGARRSDALRRLSATLPPALKGVAWANAMRTGIQHWDKTGDVPQSTSKRSFARQPPIITVRDVLLTRLSKTEGKRRYVWLFSVRMSVDPRRNERVSIVGDDCCAHIKTPDEAAGGLHMFLRNIQFNDGSIVDRVDLDDSADIILVSRHRAEAWDGAHRPATLSAKVELVAPMGRWTKNLSLDLIWAPSKDRPVCWMGYGEAPQGIAPARHLATQLHCPTD